MALIKCSECGNGVSSRAAACPHCGNPIGGNATTVEQTSKVLKLQSAIAVIAFLFGASLFLYVAWTRSERSPEAFWIAIGGLGYYTAIQVSIWWRHH